MKEQEILDHIKNELPMIYDNALKAIEAQLPTVIECNRKLQGQRLRNSDRKFKNLLNMYVRQIIGGIVLFSRRDSSCYVAVTSNTCVSIKLEDD